MTSQETATSNKQDVIKKCLKKWITPLGLGWWRVDVVYYDAPSEVINRFHDDDGISLAKTCANWQYGAAEISINLPAFEGMKDDEVERIVVHELVHILVNEMREGEIHHEERVVTSLERAFQWVWEAAEEKEKT